MRVIVNIVQNEFQCHRTAAPLVESGQIGLQRKPVETHVDHVLKFSTPGRASQTIQLAHARKPRQGNFNYDNLQWKQHNSPQLRHWCVHLPSLLLLLTLHSHGHQLNPCMRTSGLFSNKNR